MQIACGHFHSIVLTSESTLFTFGKNSSGQLGLGIKTATNYLPMPIESLK